MIPDRGNHSIDRLKSRLEAQTEARRAGQAPAVAFTQHWLAQITATAAMGSSDSRFVYTIEEIELSITMSDAAPSSASASAKTGGRTGQAINLAEIRNQDSTGIAFGVDRSLTDYPSSSFAPRPITGGGPNNNHQLDQLIEIIGWTVADDGTRIWLFDRQGTHDGNCS